MITQFILSAIAGLVTHQSKSVIDRHITGVWNYFFRVMIGDLAKLPTTVVLFLGLSEKNIPDARKSNSTWAIVERLTIAYILSSGTFFLGVLLGYFIDAVRGE